MIFVNCKDTDQDEVTKRMIVTTFSGHRYLQTNFDTSTSLKLTNKLFKVIPNNLNVDV